MSERAEAGRRRGRPIAAVLGGGLLALAMPGMIGWGGPLLVLPGLMICYSVWTGSPRRLRDGYLFGCVFMAGFSWSVHHVLFAAYLAIVLVGGLYFALGAAAVPRGPRGRVLGFGLAVAGAFWLRAVMPEIYYPHGQPAHSLYRWPLLLRGGIALGGEPLANALLAALSASLVETWRSWRTGEPPFGAARRGLAVTLAVVVAVSVGGSLARAHPAPEAEVSIAALEPGLHPMDPYEGLGAEQRSRRFAEILERRLLRPTHEILSGGEAPDLVLWPESSLYDVFDAERLAAGRARLPLPGPWPAVSTRLLVGAMVERDGVQIPSGLLVDPRSGAVLGHHEKLRPVPGGEFLPFASWLPTEMGAAVRKAFSDALGTPPDGGAGTRQPPLETASGQRFGALLCYDNAFPGPAAASVAAGARFLVVLSNEGWYRGGAELDQLVAQTVCRAIETGVPVVRCTTDGRTVLVDRDGALAAALPPVETPTPATRVLRVTVPVGPAAEAPFPWSQGLFGPLAALWLLLGVAGAVAGRIRGR